MQKISLTLLALMLSAYLCACGGSGHSPTTETSTAGHGASGPERVSGVSQPPVTAAQRRAGLADHDGDGDAHGSKAFFDGDDEEVLRYGHSASKADTRSVAVVLKRYYEAAAADDGALACSLVAKSLAEALSEQNGGRTGATGQTGGCGVYLSKLLRESFQWSSADVRALAVIGLRMKGDQGIALIRLSSEAHQIMVEREGGRWRMGALFDTEVR